MYVGVKSFHRVVAILSISLSLPWAHHHPLPVSAIPSYKLIQRLNCVSFSSLVGKCMCDLSALDEITACTARLPRFTNASAPTAPQETVQILALDAKVDDLAVVARGSHAQSRVTHKLWRVLGNQFLVTTLWEWSHKMHQNASQECRCHLQSLDIGCLF